MNGVGDETSMTQPATESSTPPSLHPEIRDRLIQQFEQWLDQMLAGEAPPAGLPQDLLAEVQGSAPGAEQQNCDLYTLFSGLTTLTGEIRLQGRAFKQLVDLLAPLSEVPERLDRLEQRSERQAGDATDLPASSKEICDVMLDLYDRLGRGLDACDKGIATLRQQRRGWLRRWIRPAQAIEQSAASAEALRDAAALMLARLESVLDQWGIERIGRIGESFDPLRMTVIQVRPTSEFEPGTVLEINRSGYALHGQLKATAQVTVARAESVMEQRDV